MGWVRLIRRLYQRRALHILVVLVFLWAIYAIYSSSLVTSVRVGGATLLLSTHALSIVREDGTEVLAARLGLNFPLTSAHQPCSAVGVGRQAACVAWDAGFRLQMSLTQEHHVTCYHIRWEMLGKAAAPSPRDCLTVGHAHWYGMGETRTARWTLERQEVGMQPFLSADLSADRSAWGGAFGSVLQRYWLTSHGVGVHVPDTVPLHVSVDREQVCVKAQYEGSPYKRHAGHGTVLEYSICVGSDMKAVHEFMAARHWARPRASPDERLLKYPVWSTWARYKSRIDQSRVMQFAQEITEHGFQGSQLQLDDGFAPAYGDFTFDRQKFPDSLRMSKKLHNLGFRLAVWVAPFHNMDSQAFADGLGYDYFVQAGTDEVPALTKWRQGTGALLDVTRESAVTWFKKRLHGLLEEGVDSFMFAGGEASWLPSRAFTHVSLPHPLHYTTLHADTMFQMADNTAEVRAAYGNQDLPLLVRMSDRLSCWDHNLGLKSVIPTALTLGLIGYPFILPDAAGGSAGWDVTSDVDETYLPSKELFVRWVQVSAFLPAMHFSIAPWQYDTDTVKIARKFAALHETLVYPRVLRLARQAGLTGEPIIRPLWWADPSDPNTHGISDQFLVGSDLLVAPITEQGATSRTLYLPRGRWRRPVHRDRTDHPAYSGPRWLTDYPVPLDDIAYFERIND